jgi:predicted lipid-binding transport protein (Tim44 family)
MFNRGSNRPSGRLKHAMQYLFITLLALHALSAVFWVGTSFTFARLGKAPEPALRRAQRGAGIGAILTGAAMGALMHRDGAFGGMQMTLAIGAIAALIAFAVQLAPRIGAEKAQRIAAPLLALALVAMVVARYLG